MRRNELGFDLVERKGSGVDDVRAGRAIAQEVARHDRAGIETDRATPDQIAAAHGDQIGRARPGANEVHGHGADSCGEAASAQVAAPTITRGTINVLAGPAAASAAASATEPTPASAVTRSERVSTRPFAAVSSSSGTTTKATPNFSAASRMPGSPLFACIVAIASRASALICARASAVR